MKSIIASFIAPFVALWSGLIVLNANRPAFAAEPVPPATMASASDVRLLPGSPLYDRQELHRKGYLLALDPDRLLFEYRKLAKLDGPQGTKPYGGWDSGFIRGHMAGHYLSAASRMAAATGDEVYKQRVDYLVTELGKCQAALDQDGYLAAFPSTAFDSLEHGAKNNSGVVVPYYTIHKIMAGMLDAYHYTGNKQALDIAATMAGYFQRRIARLSPEEIERIFRTDVSRNPQNEFGGMADVLTELYTVTGDRAQLALANVFDRPWFVTPLATGEDHLKNLHANTHVAQAAGLARYANVTDDPTSLAASQQFWRIVTEQHSFVIGGNAFHEWFDGPGVEAGPSIDGKRSLPATTAESCNTQNMLKLTSRLIERSPDNAAYADYYERALLNHLLATIAPDTGAMTYFLPLHGDFRTYLNGTFCCVGSGIENPARYNEGIYCERGSDLWVNLYVPSALDWASQEIRLKQEGNLPVDDSVTLTITQASAKKATLHLRIPYWVAAGTADVAVNGSKVETAANPSSFVSIERNWTTGDVITIKLPARLRIERAKDVPTMASVCYGPYVLAGRLGSEGMPNDFADKDAYLNRPAAAVPAIVNESASPGDWLTLVDRKSLTFRTHDAGPATGITFEPLYAVHHERYSVYWPVVTPAEATTLPAPATQPAAAAKQDPDVIDQVRIADTESERAHDSLFTGSTTGKLPTGEPWRDASPNGSIQYVLAIGPADKRKSLVCTYWGGDTGRTFDIIVNGVTIATQTLQAQKPGALIEAKYPLPAEALNGQQNATVRFQGVGQGRVGGVFGVRLILDHEMK